MLHVASLNKNGKAVELCLFVLAHCGNVLIKHYSMLISYYLGHNHSSFPVSFLPEYQCKSCLEHHSLKPCKTIDTLITTLKGNDVKCSNKTRRGSLQFLFESSNCFKEQ